MNHYPGLPKPPPPPETATAKADRQFVANLWRVAQGWALVLGAAGILDHLDPDVNYLGAVPAAGLYAAVFTVLAALAEVAVYGRRR
jgi:hypothetical protein